MRRCLLTVLLTLCCVASCRRPEAMEQFLRVDQSQNGIYPFSLDMSDSLARYTVSFYTAIDGKRQTVAVPLQVIWVSPSGKNYSETVYMKAGVRSGDREVYRSGIVPNEYGEWTLAIASLHDVKGFRGIGVILEREADGTR